MSPLIDLDTRDAVTYNETVYREGERLQNSYKCYEIQFTGIALLLRLDGNQIQVLVSDRYNADGEFVGIQTFGGKKKKKERPVEGAVRELDEESGIGRGSIHKVGYGVDGLYITIDDERRRVKVGSTLILFTQEEGLDHLEVPPKEAGKHGNIRWMNLTDLIEISNQDSNHKRDKHPQIYHQLLNRLKSQKFLLQLHQYLFSLLNENLISQDSYDAIFSQAEG